MKVTSTKVKFAPFSSPVLDDIAEKLPEAIFKGELSSYIAEASTHPTVGVVIEEDRDRSQTMLRFSDGEFTFSFIVTREMLEYSI